MNNTLFTQSKGDIQKGNPKQKPQPAGQMKSKTGRAAGAMQALAKARTLKGFSKPQMVC